MQDLISRQMAIDALERKKDKNAKGDMGGFYNKIIQNDIDALIQLPSAQPGWIPCSKRLPKDGTWCLFTDGENMSVERYKADAIDAFFPTGRWFDLDDAVAWMPLPKPWKGEQDG